MQLTINEPSVEITSRTLNEKHPEGVLEAAGFTAAPNVLIYNLRRIGMTPAMLAVYMVVKAQHAGKRIHDSFLVHMTGIPQRTLTRLKGELRKLKGYNGRPLVAIETDTPKPGEGGTFTSRGSLFDFDELEREALRLFRVRHLEDLEGQDGAIANMATDRWPEWPMTDGQNGQMNKNSSSYKTSVIEECSSLYEHETQEFDGASSPEGASHELDDHPGEEWSKALTPDDPRHLKESMSQELASGASDQTETQTSCGDMVDIDVLLCSGASFDELIKCELDAISALADRIGYDREYTTQEQAEYDTHLERLEKLRRAKDKAQAQASLRAFKTASESEENLTPLERIFERSQSANPIIRNDYDAQREREFREAIRLEKASKAYAARRPFAAWAY